MIAGRSAAHVVRHFLGFDGPETQTTAAEQETLRLHASGKRRLVEIGVFEGYTTRRLAEAMAPDGELYAVDPFLSGRIGVCWGELIARRELAHLRRQRRVEFVKAFSHEANQQLTGVFDFVFFDGDHSLDGIKRDWADWSPRIAPGGIIALHDSIVPPHNPAVVELGSCQYFDSHIRHDPAFAIVAQTDSLSVLRRS